MGRENKELLKSRVREMILKDSLGETMLMKWVMRRSDAS